MILPAQVHIFDRNGTFYFHRRIPKDLLSLHSSQQIIFSLKRIDPQEADRLARIESVKLDQEFQHHRSNFQIIYEKKFVERLFEFYL